MIKYHDNKNGVQYGADRTLTNNWNPDLNYGNEYVNIYFRIETKGYNYPSFSFTNEDRKLFDNDIYNVFSSLGWMCKEAAYNGSCSTWCKGKSHLYLHPQNFSGVVLKNRVKTIAEALKENQSFKLRWVDLYETVYDITDEEYEIYLSQKDEDIKKKILEISQTKRTNRYYSINDIVRIVSDMFRLRRIGENDGRNYGVGQTGKHVLNIINLLVDAGYIVKCEFDEALIRAINKTEQKQRKLFI